MSDQTVGRIEQLTPPELQLLRDVVIEAEQRTECERHVTYGQTCEHTFRNAIDFCDGCLFRLVVAIAKAEGRP